MVKDLNILYFYDQTDFKPSTEKFLYSMISTIQLIENSTILVSLNNDSRIKIIGDSEFFEEFKNSFEKYQNLQKDFGKNNFLHYFSVCNESEKQLRAIEKQIFAYKNAITVIFI